MKKVVSLFKKWREKQNFLHLASTMDAHLLADIGYSQDAVEEKVRKPFWKY